MNSLGMTLVAVILLIGLVTALPNELSAALMKKRIPFSPEHNDGRPLRTLIFARTMSIFSGSAECCKGKKGKV
ncbi:hypothetical protein TNIN_266521 [Trichonephila inaurata madagascariensis]|uniref:Uncharacterized protein n=1 Tax=Trichonephila inaurata madagascariensis TaxID=2747483 RepID=A0A8X7CFP6_9ARAC|nr:hypothetical protein TNIN_266521 [Trichonephila inaurata madagascariensis]